MDISQIKNINGSNMDESLVNSTLRDDGEDFILPSQPISAAASQQKDSSGYSGATISDNTQTQLRDILADETISNSLSIVSGGHAVINETLSQIEPSTLAEQMGNSNPVYSEDLFSQTQEYTPIINNALDCLLPETPVVPTGIPTALENVISDQFHMFSDVIGDATRVAACKVTAVEAVVRADDPNKGTLPVEHSFQCADTEPVYMSTINIADSEDVIACTKVEGEQLDVSGGNYYGPTSGPASTPDCPMFEEKCSFSEIDESILVAPISAKHEIKTGDTVKSEALDEIQPENGEECLKQNSIDIDSEIAKLSVKLKSALPDGVPTDRVVFESEPMFIESTEQMHVGNEGSLKKHSEVNPSRLLREADIEANVHVAESNSIELKDMDNVRKRPSGLKELEDLNKAHDDPKTRADDIDSVDDDNGKGRSGTDLEDSHNETFKVPTSYSSDRGSTDLHVMDSKLNNVNERNGKDCGLMEKMSQRTSEVLSEAETEAVPSLQSTPDSHYGSINSSKNDSADYVKIPVHYLLEVSGELHMRADDREILRKEITKVQLLPSGHSEDGYLASSESSHSPSSVCSARLSLPYPLHRRITPLNSSSGSDPATCLDSEPVPLSSPYDNPWHNVRLITDSFNKTLPSMIGSIITRNRYGKAMLRKRGSFANAVVLEGVSRLTVDNLTQNSSKDSSDIAIQTDGRVTQDVAVDAQADLPNQLPSAANKSGTSKMKRLYTGTGYVSDEAAGSPPSNEIVEPTTITTGLLNIANGVRDGEDESQSTVDKSRKLEKRKSPIATHVLAAATPLKRARRRGEQVETPLTSPHKNKTRKDIIEKESSSTETDNREHDVNKSLKKGRKAAITPKAQQTTRESEKSDSVNTALKRTRSRRFELTCNVGPIEKTELESMISTPLNEKLSVGPYKALRGAEANDISPVQGFGTAKETPKKAIKGRGRRKIGTPIPEQTSNSDTSDPARAERDKVETPLKGGKGRGSTIDPPSSESSDARITETARGGKKRKSGDSQSPLNETPVIVRKGRSKNIDTPIPKVRTSESSDAAMAEIIKVGRKRKSGDNQTPLKETPVNVGKIHGKRIDTPMPKARTSESSGAMVAESVKAGRRGKSHNQTPLKETPVNVRKGRGKKLDTPKTKVSTSESSDAAIAETVKAGRKRKGDDNQTPLKETPVNVGKGRGKKMDTPKTKASTSESSDAAIAETVKAGRKRKSDDNLTPLKETAVNVSKGRGKTFGTPKSDVPSASDNDAVTDKSVDDGTKPYINKEQLSGAKGRGRKPDTLSSAKRTENDLLPENSRGRSKKKSETDSGTASDTKNVRMGVAAKSFGTPKGRTGFSEESTPPKRSRLVKTNSAHRILSSSEGLSSSDEPCSFNSAETAVMSFGPGVRVFSKWSDQFFYSGIITKDGGPGKWYVKFDDGSMKQIAESFMLPLSVLGEGYAVHVLVREEYESGLIITLKPDQSYVVDVNGKEITVSPVVMRLDKEQVAAIRSDCGPSALLNTPGTSSQKSTVDPDNIISSKRRGRRPEAGPFVLTSSNRKPRKLLTMEACQGLEYTPCLELDVSVLRLSEIRSPPSTSRRRLLNDAVISSDLGPVPPQGSAIFANMFFLFSYAKPERKLTKSEMISDCSGEDDDVEYYKKEEKVTFNEEHLRKQITAGGGTVLDKFEDIPPTQFTNTRLVTNRPSKTARFLLCLAHGIEAVLHGHIIQATRGRDIREMKMIHSGWSVINSRWMLRPRSHSHIFKNTNIAVYSESKDSLADALFHKFWTLVLSKTGATILKGEELSFADVIVTDSSVPSHMLEFIESLGGNGPSLVSTNWVVQSLIHGQPIKSTLDTSFRYDYTSASS